MKITFSPQRRDDSLTASRAGDVLTLNGMPLDFPPLPEGVTLPANAIGNDWIAGDVSRIGGVLHIPLILPHGTIPSPAPEASRVVTHPLPIEVATEGPITLPSWAPPEPAPDSKTTNAEEPAA